MKCLPGAYGEYLGFELLTIMCGIYDDIHVTAAWVSVQSVCMFTYGLGFGLASTTRNFVGQALGMDEMLLARKYAKYCCIYGIFLGIIYGSLLIRFAGRVASILTSVPENFEMTKIFIQLYGISSI